MLVLIPSKSNINKNNTSTTQTQDLITKLPQIKETFNLSNYSNQILTGNVTYADALSQAYASNHSQNEFYYFISTLPEMDVYQTGIVNITLSQNSKVIISSSDSYIYINLNNHYGYIIVSGSYNNITIANGLYNTLVEVTGTAKGNKLNYKDAYEVKPW